MALVRGNDPNPRVAPFPTKEVSPVASPAPGSSYAPSQTSQGAHRLTTCEGVRRAAAGDLSLDPRPRARFGLFYGHKNNRLASNTLAFLTKRKFRSLTRC